MTVSPSLARTWEGDISEIVSRRGSWDDFSGARVLVTGASGFLGGYVTRTLLGLNRLSLLDRPVRVTALVRDARRAGARLDDVLDDPSFDLIEWDLCSFAVPPVDRVDYVVHAASHASPRHYGVDPFGTMLPNVVGTASLLTGLDPSQLRGFLFLSSGAVYGEIRRHSGLVSESDYGLVDPLEQRSCYAEAKRAGEALCAAWSRQHDSRCMIARPWHTYGPGLQPDDGRVFADFAFNVVRGEDIALTSDGSACRAYCYVTDAICALFDVLLHGESGEAYNVANAAGMMSVLELAQLLVGLFPERDLRVVRTPVAPASCAPPNADRLLPDVSKLERFGWTARVPPAEGFRRMIDAYDPAALDLPFTPVSAPQAAGL